MIKVKDGTNINKLSNGSHKIIIFNCEQCNKEVEQQYRNYIKQRNGKLCRSCRNKKTANNNDVKEKQSIASKKMWENEEHRKHMSDVLSKACKKAWENPNRKREPNNKTEYNILLNSIQKDNHTLLTTENEYKKNNTIKIKCPNGHIYKTNYTKWKLGHRCLECRKVNFNEIIQSFADEKYILLSNENDYINNNTKLKYKCPKGHIHNISWSNWILGHRCAKCADTISKAELEISEYVEQLGLNILNKDRIIINPFELDIVIPDKKVAIEYCGLYWHGERKGKYKKYHLNKLDRCNEQGYRLITIFEDEWLHKKNIVKNRLRHILQNSNDKIYARNCIIKEISNREALIFAETYHIQGYHNSSIRLGAYYNDNLVAIMTFAKGNIAKGSKNLKNVWELSRFCISDIPIIGIASKLLKYFQRNYEWEVIYSYADRRWSDGNVYSKIGFNNEYNTKPNYWYFKDTKRFHRFNFRKDKIKHLGNGTEWDIMQNQGYDRIWDCGNIKYMINKE